MGDRLYADREGGLIEGGDGETEPGGGEVVAKDKHQVAGAEIAGTQKEGKGNRQQRRQRHDEIARIKTELSHEGAPQRQRAELQQRHVHIQRLLAALDGVAHRLPDLQVRREGWDAIWRKLLSGDGDNPIAGFQHRGSAAEIDLSSERALARVGRAVLPGVGREAIDVERKRDHDQAPAASDRQRQPGAAVEAAFVCRDTGWQHKSSHGMGFLYLS